MAETMLPLFKTIIPTLTSSLHKGSSGRVGIIGGSLEYTGAPYFSAISALKAGADLVHVFCAQAAAPVIKSYSPELIVHPLLDDSNAVERICPWLDRLHALVIGPGLGRDPDIFETVRAVIKRAPSIPIVIDADGIQMLIESMETFHNSSRPLIVTPNAVEMTRLQAGQLTLPPNSLILQKGATDLILDHEFTKLSSYDEPGSLRRCGGQGDVLSGVAGVFSAWAHMKTPGDLNQIRTSVGAASVLTRRCSHLAFKKYRRSMVASNLIEFIQVAFEELFER